VFEFNIVNLSHSHFSPVLFAEIICDFRRFRAISSVVCVFVSWIMSLQIGQKVGNCNVVQFLGAGGFGRVFRVVNTVTKFEFACKVTVLRAVEIAAAESEVSIHKQLHHVNVIRFYEANCQKNVVLISLELASGCLMDIARKGLSVPLCRLYFRDLISGVEYMHSMCVAHRDIKTENLLIGGDGRLKIADFGLATQFSPRKMVVGMCGTLQYMAPEVHTGLYHPQPADIWSCGVVLLEMLTQNCHWPSTVSLEYSYFHKNILSCCSGLVLGWIDLKAQHLLRGMLHQDSDCRVDIFYIRNHPWFLDC
jgi:serine/threonine-protein kinase CHEK1